MVIDPVELTRALVGFDTINPPGHQAACARYLAEVLNGHGFSITLQEYGDGRVNIVATAGKRPQPPLCFTGHLDTVPVSDADAWVSGPFEPRVSADGKPFSKRACSVPTGVSM